MPVILLLFSQIHDANFIIYHLKNANVYYKLKVKKFKMATHAVDRNCKFHPISKNKILK